MNTRDAVSSFRYIKPTLRGTSTHPLLDVTKAMRNKPSVLHTKERYKWTATALPLHLQILSKDIQNDI